MTSPHPALILASSSPGRRELLARLRLPFEAVAPDIDETPLPNEDVVTLVRRLSEAKALALASRYPDALIIGSDQALALDGLILGKPGHHAAAYDQLARLSGREATFHTGLCLLNAATGRRQVTVEPFTVQMRELEAATIERYLLADQPYGCAGSFKAEGLGIALFRGFSGRDPSSLVGLPLMALVDMLRSEGLMTP